MSLRTSFRDYACTAVALLTVLSGAETALGQQEKEIDIWTAAPSDLTFAVTQVPPVPNSDAGQTHGQRANIYRARSNAPR
jgi:hypothetical protein